MISDARLRIDGRAAKGVSSLVNTPIQITPISASTPLARPRQGSHLTPYPLVMPRLAFACKGLERGLRVSIEGKSGLVERQSHLQSFQFSRWCLRGDLRFADDRKEEAQIARRACHRANYRKVQISNNARRRHKASLRDQSIGWLVRENAAKNLLGCGLNHRCRPQSPTP